MKENIRKKHVQTTTSITKTHAMKMLENHCFFPIRMINDARLNQLLRTIGDVHGKIIADIGCEAGRLISRITQVRMPRKIYAVDLSSYALTQAKKYAKNEGWYDRTSFIRADAEQVPIKDMIVDIAISSNVLEHLHNPQLGFNELVRMTKLGGHVIVHVPYETKIIFAKKIVHGIHPRLLGHLKIVTPGHLHFPNKQFVRDLVKNCPHKIKLVSLKTGPALSIFGLYLYAVIVREM